MGVADRSPRARRPVCERTGGERERETRVARALLGKSYRDDFRNFAAEAERGFEYLTELEELFDRAVGPENTGDMKGSYEIIPCFGGRTSRFPLVGVAELSARS